MFPLSLCSIYLPGWNEFSPQTAWERTESFCCRGCDDDHDENCGDDGEYDDFDEDDNVIFQTQFMVIHKLIGSKMVCAHLLERLSIALQDPTKYSLIS